MKICIDNYLSKIFTSDMKYGMGSQKCVKLELDMIERRQKTKQGIIQTLGIEIN